METRTKSSVDDGIIYDSHKGLGPWPHGDEYWCYDVRVIEYQPGNGTRYQLVLTALDFVDSRKENVLDLPRKTVVVNVLGVGTLMLVRDQGLLHPSYVMEKLDCLESDAIVLTELLASLLNRKSTT